MSASEYFESNGNGHPKAFKIGPPDDPVKFKILAVRRRVQQFKELGTGERLFFDWILDLALNSNENERLGVVTVSEQACARQLGVSARTISRWKWKLIRITGELWLSKAYRPNMFPSDVYHVTVLDAPRESRQPTNDGIYGGPATRSAPRPALGCRKPGQKSLPLPGIKAVHPVESTQVPDLSAESGQICRLTADTDGGSQPTNLSAESRQGCRLTADTNDGGEPTKMAADSRQPCAPSADTSGALKRGSVKRKEPSREGEGSAPPDSGLEEWIKGLRKALPSHLLKLHTDFKGKVAHSKNPERKADLQRRLAAIEELLYGPPLPPDEPAPKPKAPQRPPAEATAEQILEGALYLIENKKEHLLTAAQREALARAEVTP